MGRVGRGMVDKGEVGRGRLSREVWGVRMCAADIGIHFSRLLIFLALFNLGYSIYGKNTLQF